MADSEELHPNFESFGLDPRLTKCLAKINICKPTLVQEKAIPLALTGKDLLVKAKTGSGKTFSYLLPIMHNLLSIQKSDIRLLVLVPTKELAKQVASSIQLLMHYFPKDITCMNLTGEESFQLQRSMLTGKPTILISTPSRILPHLDSKAITFSNLEFLVIDEADLVLSFGYSQDLQRLIQEYIPKVVQTFLMSATLSTEIDSLKQLVLRSPVILKLEEADDEPDKLQQYVIRCEEDDKFLIIYVALKLKLLNGKLLIFTNDIERCFKLKLFLEQFGIKTCLLNSELPVSSRHHIVDEFNRGVYDIIIASDIQSTTNPSRGGAALKNDKKFKIKSDKEAGVARGVDFKRVDVVINFDLPQKIDSYVHRVGRTARGGESGISISLISSSTDEAILKLIEADQENRGRKIQPHSFDFSQLDGFRYRCSDALRSVTKASIKTARLQSVKEEIFRSEKLKTFFDERPKDLNLLRHDKSIGVVKSRPHLKHVPEYLMEVAGEDKDGTKRAKLEPLAVTEKDPKSTGYLRKKPNNNRQGKKRNNPLDKIKRHK